MFSDILLAKVLTGGGCGNKRLVHFPRVSINLSHRFISAGNVLADGTAYDHGSGPRLAFCLVRCTDSGRRVLYVLGPRPNNFPGKNLCPRQTSAGTIDWTVGR